MHSFRKMQMLVHSIMHCNYTQKYPMQPIKTDNWFDIGHEDKYYNSRLEVRAREFNHITIDKNRGILGNLVMTKISLLEKLNGI